MKWLQLEFSPRVYPSIKPQSGCQTLAQDELPYFLALLASSSFQSRALETEISAGEGWGEEAHWYNIACESELASKLFPPTAHFGSSFFTLVIENKSKKNDSML